MFKTFFKMSAVLLLGIVGVSCSSSDDNSSREVKPVSGFSLLADTKGQTMATDWQKDDAIGVFARETGKTLSAGNLLEGAANVKFTTLGNIVFTPADADYNAYPLGVKSVDFVAYSPYSEAVKEMQLAVSIKDQKTLQRHPLLYAAQTRAKNGDLQPTLNFENALATVRFHLQSEKHDLSDYKVALVNVATEGVWNLKSGKIAPIAEAKDTLRLALEGESKSKWAEAQVFASPNATLMLQIITAKNDTTYQTVVRNTPLRANHISKYVVIIKSEAKPDQGGGGQPDGGGDKPGGGGDKPEPGGGDDKPSGDSGNYMETPYITAEQNLSKDLMYVMHTFGNDKRNYAMLYNKEWKYAEWVAYPLYRGIYNGGNKRPRNFSFDPSVPQWAQCTATSHGYGTGYDRGHQIPNADRNGNKEAQLQTFYVTNITPQASRFNQRIWLKLEERTRDWADNVDTLYVVTGALPPEGNRTMKGARVPAGYYKAFCFIDKSRVAHTAAFYFPLNREVGHTDFSKYKCTVKSLESKTGFTFFPRIREQFKEKIDPFF